MPLKKTIALAALGLPALGVLAYKGAFASLFGMNYLPHRYCYLAQPWLIWSNVTMDALIAASYIVIFSCLFWITARLRRFTEIHAFLWILIALGLFIVACASTHLMEVVTIWWPLYRLSVVFKVLCAASSVATAILFAKAVRGLTLSIHQLLVTLPATQRAYASSLVEREQVQAQFTSSEALQAEQLHYSRQALEDKSLMLQSVLDSMVEGLVAANEQGQFILWNPAAEELIGLGAAGMTSKQWSTHYGIFLPDKVTPVPPGQNPLERAMRGEVVHSEIFFRNPQLDREAWLEINSSPLRGKDGALRGGVAAFRDITQRKADELEIRTLNNELEDKIAKRTEQWEVANRELEAFSYSVSHDLRTPLRHIAGFSRILVSEFGPGMTGEAREHLQRIEGAVRRMGLLLDALLSMAVLRRRAPKLSHTELNPLITEVISVLAPECEGREVEWRIAPLPALDCDPVLMSQVFQNLLSNALKYSCGRTPAVIEVDSIQQTGKPVIVLVRDNGAGFDMRYARRLFGMFQRLHTESEFAGTGVGLATVHRIIQKHGGLIWAEAEPDHGATFYFSLQVAEPAEVTAKATAFPLTWPNGLA
jgi:PAS domain S-box-containing protein